MKKTKKNVLEMNDEEFYENMTSEELTAYENDLIGWDL